MALVLWGGLYLILGPLSSPGDGDLYWQRWLGDSILRNHQLPSALGHETFTAVGAPWVPQEWLFSILVAITTDHALFLLFSIFFGALPLAMLCSIWFRSREIAKPEAVGIVLLFCGMAFAESYGVRAQVLGWSCFAVFMLFVERRDRWYYAVVPVTILWANLHASVAIAPAVIAVRIVAAALDGGWRALRSSRDAIALPLVLLATLCTPLGAKLPLYAIQLAGSPIRRYIAEWQPPALHDSSFTLGALPLALAILLGGPALLRSRKRAAFTAALLFLATLFASRNISLFAIAAAPLGAQALTLRFPTLVRLGSRLRELETVGLVAIVVALGVAAAAVVQLERHGSRALLPIAAIDALASDSSRHRLFCENFTWCSIALGFPQLRVFIDGRCDPYPLPVWRHYIAAIRPGDAWRRTLNDDRVDAVVASTSSNLAKSLHKDSHWKAAFDDESYVLFRRE